MSLIFTRFDLEVRKIELRDSEDFGSVRLNVMLEEANFPVDLDVASGLRSIEVNKKFSMECRNLHSVMRIRLISDGQVVGEAKSKVNDLPNSKSVKIWMLREGEKVGYVRVAKEVTEELAPKEEKLRLVLRYIEFFGSIESKEALRMKLFFDEKEIDDLGSGFSLKNERKRIVFDRLSFPVSSRNFVNFVVEVRERSAQTNRRPEEKKMFSCSFRVSECDWDILNCESLTDRRSKFWGRLYFEFIGAKEAEGGRSARFDSLRIVERSINEESDQSESLEESHFESRGESLNGWQEPRDSHGGRGDSKEIARSFEGPGSILKLHSLANLEKPKSQLSLNDLRDLVESVGGRSTISKNSKVSKSSKNLKSSKTSRISNEIRTSKELKNLDQSNGSKNSKPSRKFNTKNFKHFAQFSNFNSSLSSGSSSSEIEFEVFEPQRRRRFSDKKSVKGARKTDTGYPGGGDLPLGLRLSEARKNRDSLKIKVEEEGVRGIIDSGRARAAEMNSMRQKLEAARSALAEELQTLAQNFQNEANFSDIEALRSRTESLKRTLEEKESLVRQLERESLEATKRLILLQEKSRSLKESVPVRPPSEDKLDKILEGVPESILSERFPSLSLIPSEKNFVKLKHEYSQLLETERKEKESLRKLKTRIAEQQTILETLLAQTQPNPQQKTPKVARLVPKPEENHNINIPKLPPVIIVKRPPATSRDHPKEQNPSLKPKLNVLRFFSLPNTGNIEQNSKEFHKGESLSASSFSDSENSQI